MNIVSLKWDYSFKELMGNDVVRRCFISDVLEIPQEQIKSVYLSNTFLWKRYQAQKQGVLDILVELNDNTRIDIELQIRFFADWDRRSLYYLAKMFTSDLRRGEDYHKLKRCICINILDYKFKEDGCYHTVYRMRDEDGRDFSELFEIHIIELGKELTGTRLDDWIRLINATTEEDLDMIKTDNPGIQAAIKEVKIMSLSKKVRAVYEQHLKEKRDRRAIDKYIRETALKEGHEEGLAKGLAEGLAEGHAEGHAEGQLDGLRLAITELLRRNGRISRELQEYIDGQGDEAVLRSWCAMAADSGSIGEFERKIGLRCR